MSASASDPRNRLPTDDPQLSILAESSNDTHGTRMAYEAGINLPWFIVLAWGVFAVAYVTYQLIYLLPDLKAWFAAGN